MKLTPALCSSPVITRHPQPILTANDIPYDAALIFNAGAAKWQGKYVLVFRNDYGTDEAAYNEGQGTRFAGTSIGVAYSDNGVDNWQIVKKPLIDSHDLYDPEIRRFYDPRITILEGKPYLCLAMDTRHGVSGCVAALNESLDQWTILSKSVPDNRNLVLFPERIGGKYVRLERPFPVYSRGRDRFDLWSSQSPDLVYWGESSLVLAVEDVPFANNKIGPAAPPVRTKQGWLTLFHAVDKDESRGKNGWERAWQKRYTAGIMLLDAEDPTRVVGMSKLPLLAPETQFETEIGFRQNVIFPCGMILEDDGEVKIYYGASDTVTCLARADVNELLQLCTEQR